MAQITLKGERRTQKGTQAAKKLRNDGLLPGVVYGTGEPPIPVVVPAREFETLLHNEGRNAIVSLILDGEDDEGQITLMKEIQHHPLNDCLLHVDFQRIALTQKIIREIPVVSDGIAIGVRSEMGVLQHSLHAVEVECLASEIPDQISVDVSELAVNASIHVRELLSLDSRIVTDPDRLVFLVAPPTVEKEPVEDEEAEIVEEEEPAEPELSVERGKKEEEEAKEEK